MWIIIGFLVGLFLGACVVSISSRDYNRGYRHGFTEGEIHGALDQRIKDNYK